MNPSDLKKEINRIGEMISGWDGGVSEIERAIVLGKLKDLYEAVMFSGKEGCASSDAASNCTAPETIFELPTAGEAQERATDTAGADAAGERPTEDETVKDTPSPQIRKPISRSVIMSLYGDEEPVNIAVPAGVESEEDIPAQQTAPEVPANEDEAPTEQDEEVQIVIETTTISVSSAPDEPASSEEPGASPAEQPTTDETAKETAPHTSPAAKSVLGEVMGMNMRPTIGESLPGRDSQYDTMARSQLSSRDLRHSIAANERFIIVRDLFSGDISTYDKAVEELGAFTDLDDALIYIHENFSGLNPDCEGVIILMDLLEKRLK